MDLNFTEDEERFRQDVRTFLASNLPKRLSDKVRRGQHQTKADIEEWQAILSHKGWLAPHWPVEYGGAGWTATQKFIWEREAALAHTPMVVPFGLSMLAPVLIKYGNEEQKAYWLPRMLRGDDWWCQGYSEPGAGSDLANVRTTAVREGDVYVVNGQKTWTTLGQNANMIFCLVRTDNSGSRQQGISFLLIDMATPGVEVRPIITLDGDHEVNEVFLTDVRVPVENLVGEEGKGWTYAKYLLTYERTSMAGVGRSSAMLDNLQSISRDEQQNGRPLAEDPLFAARLAEAEIELTNLTTTAMRVVSAVQHGDTAGAGSSILKIKGTELQQQIASLARRAVGPYAHPFVSGALSEGFNEDHVGPEYAASLVPTYLNLRKLSIFGGSNEIQKNIIAKAVLQL